LRDVVDNPTIHRRQRRRCCRVVDDDILLDLALPNDAEASVAALPVTPLPLLVLPLIRHLFDELGGEGVTFLLPALPPEDVPEVDAEDTEDASRTKLPPLPPLSFVGLSSDFH